MSVPAAIPLVTGRHRNRALSAARQARAVQLATEGHTYQQIADELGYANRGTVHHIVHDALARDRKDAVEHHHQLELARLDAVQAALWDRAMAGDVEAAREVRAVIMARCRLLGLDEKAKRQKAWAPRTVVLSAEDREVLRLHDMYPLGGVCRKTPELAPSARPYSARARDGEVAGLEVSGSCAVVLREVVHEVAQRASGVADAATQQALHVLDRGCVG